MPEGTQPSGPQLPKNSFLRLFVKEIRMRAPSAEQWRAYDPQLRAVERNQHPLADIAEAARTALSLTPGHPQILSALAMIDGKVVELAPGAGKTLAAAMAAAFHALRGHRVHVFRRDGVLARRDAVWMADLYSELGLTTGYVTPETDPDQRARMRRRNIVYMTPADAALDFLRDSIAVTPGSPLPADEQYPYLIADDAEWTLVALASRQIELWAGDRLPPAFAKRVAELVQELEPGEDYEGGEEGVQLTERGLHAMEAGLLCNLRHPANQPILAGVAETLCGFVKLQREVAEGAAQSAPEGHDAHLQFTGRVLNSITVRSLIGGYGRLAGIGSATLAESSELSELYKLDVVAVPDGHESLRIDHPNEIFSNAATRNRAVATAADLEHANGRPIVIATMTIPQATAISDLLDTLGVDHRIVSGAVPEAAAEFLSQAGQKGAVTVLTPHAPIGIDIPLGDEVVSLGGLLVLGASRSRFRRMDDYFRNLAGRKGQPGETRFYVSRDDEAIVDFGLDTLLDDAKTATRAMEDVQWVVQIELLALTKALARFEDFVEEQRRVLRALRTAVMRGDAATLLGNLHPKLLRRHIARYGERTLSEMEQRARLERIDDAWAEYIAWVAGYADQRWLSATGLDPLRDFQVEAERTFHSLRRGMEEEVVTLFDNDEMPAGPPSSFDRDAVGSYQLPEPPWARSRQRVAEAVCKRLSALGVLET